MKIFILFIMWLLWLAATCTILIPVCMYACDFDWFNLGNNLYKGIVNEK